VRSAAREVYVRRVYRAHQIEDVKQSENDDGSATIQWKFMLRDLPANEAAVRYGTLCVVDKFADVAGKMPAMLKEFKAMVGEQASTDEFLNTFHVVVKEQSTIEPEAVEEWVEAAEKTLAEHKEDLSGMGVRHVTYLVPQSSSATTTRRSRSAATCAPRSRTSSSSRASRATTT